MIQLLSGFCLLCVELDEGAVNVTLEKAPIPNPYRSNSDAGVAFATSVMHGQSSCVMQIGLGFNARTILNTSFKKTENGNFFLIELAGMEFVPPTDLGSPVAVRYATAGRRELDMDHAGIGSPDPRSIDRVTGLTIINNKRTG